MLSCKLGRTHMSHLRYYWSTLFGLRRHHFGQDSVIRVTYAEEIEQAAYYNGMSNAQARSSGSTPLSSATGGGLTCSAWRTISGPHALTSSSLD